MEELDGDEGLVDSYGRKAQRDLVQFVEFNKFQGSQYALANEVLKELPDQIVEYYLLKRIFPNDYQIQAGINYMDFVKQKQIKEDKNGEFLGIFFLIFVGIIIYCVFFQ
ncbi:hypothetical protein IMG5_091760 [Ichthyophthirius multifiliis]|uniref:Copine C-terminal domain-containing protein n=1 Tax=Ichthyophthirius multifiliis TaxID=5932 RepID=G0QRD0_ICHMU|nr:hypothetical protein IMG5_091760 [Ichthyophthirius multifiliis]EGR32228.1 hypothetical protein IMG5_091760 [Ichthyophthirius multifiliis]|eukprot:XP_004035714.1 hypothetical protein IMG5_091760 [Ichthyophthirius multifiliis]